MNFTEEERDILRNKDIIIIENQADDVYEWKDEFLEYGLSIPLDNLEDLSIGDISIIKREYELGKDGYLYNCEQFLFKGKLMYERFYIEENGGDWSDVEDVTGKDYTENLEKELRNYIVEFYMSNS